VRRLDMVYARRQAVPAPLRLSQGPGHTGPTALPRPPQHLLQEVQPPADGRRVGCLHRRGGEGAEPPTPGPVGSADRAAALGPAGLRTSKSECQAYEGQNCRASAATTDSYPINLGTTPEYVQSLTGVAPSGGAPGKEGERGQWVCGTQVEEASAALTRSAESEGCRIRLAEPPARRNGPGVTLTLP
jgi:hypothetical protein